MPLEAGIIFSIFTWVCLIMGKRSHLKISNYVGLVRPCPMSGQLQLAGLSQGGVHICKLAYGDLTWEHSSSPESYALWYTNRGRYIKFRGSMEYFMWAISGSDLGQISPIIWTPPFMILLR